MNAMKKMAVGFVFAAACANSFAAQGRWTEGFGQGNLEYFREPLKTPVVP